MLEFLLGLIITVMLASFILLEVVAPIVLVIYIIYLLVRGD